MENKDMDLDLMIEDLTETSGERRRMVYIPIGLIFPHPDNPRRDLGDLSELANSIAESGVMQNLTVIRNVNDSRSYEKLVDGYDKNGIRYSDAYIDHMTKHAFEGSYTVVIGHRRHGAADLAGLAEVPCVISDMDYRTQIATMMAENLQRADLTVYEQVQGFKQMQLDLGMDVSMIALKTGFSVSTVRRRLKMAETLNPDTLKRVSARQITVEDLERLYEIEDPKLRDEALAEIGTVNFNSKCEAALQTEAKRKKIEGWRRICLGLGMTEIKRSAVDDRKRYDYVCRVFDHPSEDLLLENLEGKDPTSLCFHADQWGSLNIRRKKETAVIEAADKAEQRAAEEKEKQENICAALDEAFERAYFLRRGFVRGCREDVIRHHVIDVVKMAAEANRETQSRVDVDLFYALNGLTEHMAEATENPSFEVVYESTRLGIYGMLLSYVYATLADSPHLRSYVTETWLKDRGEYRENQRLRAIYDGLCKLGYEMSDEEKALLDGSSELYYRKECAV